MVTFEFKIEYDKQEFKAKKRQAAVSVISILEAILSIQAIANPQIVLNPRLHAPQLLKQANARLENLEKAVDFQQMIMQCWRCHNDECHNKNNLCYVDL